MKPLLKRTVVKVFIAIVLCALLSVLLTAVMPTFTNDMAMGQLENDDVSFMLWNTQSQISGWVDIAQAVIWGIVLISVGKDVYNFFNVRKENNTNE